MADKRSPSRRFLPPDPHAVEPYRLTPKLALRVGILGMLALAVFATLFLRLWSLQVLNGEQLLRASQNNQRRDIRVQAPRGPILDRNGDVLVTNVPGPRGPDLVVRPAKAARRALARDPRARPGPGLPANQIGAAIRRHRHDPLTPIRIKDSASRAQVFYLEERAEDFPGVQIVPAYLRSYPNRELAAHVLGYVSEISPEQLAALHSQGYRGGDTIGQTGIESYYDRYLRGTAGVSQLRVDSLGRPISLVVPKVPAASRQHGPLDARREVAEGRRRRRCGTASNAPATPSVTAAGSRTAARSSRSIHRTARSVRSRRPRRIHRRSMSVACASGRSIAPVSRRARQRR